MWSKVNQKHNAVDKEREMSGLAANKENKAVRSFSYILRMVSFLISVSCLGVCDMTSAADNLLGMAVVVAWVFLFLWFCISFSMFCVPACVCVKNDE